MKPYTLANTVVKVSNLSTDECFFDADDLASTYDESFILKTNTINRVTSAYVLVEGIKQGDSTLRTYYYYFNKYSDKACTAPSAYGPYLKLDIKSSSESASDLVPADFAYIYKTGIGIDGELEVSASEFSKWGDTIWGDYSTSAFQTISNSYSGIGSSLSNLLWMWGYSYGGSKSADVSYPVLETTDSAVDISDMTKGAGFDGLAEAANKYFEDCTDGYIKFSLGSVAPGFLDAELVNGVYVYDKKNVDDYLADMSADDVSLYINSVDDEHKAVTTIEPLTRKLIFDISSVLAKGEAIERIYIDLKDGLSVAGTTGFEVLNGIEFVTYSAGGSIETFESGITFDSDTGIVEMNAEKDVQYYFVINNKKSSDSFSTSLDTGKYSVNIYEYLLEKSILNSTTYSTENLNIKVGYTDAEGTRYISSDYVVVPFSGGNNTSTLSAPENIQVKSERGNFEIAYYFDYEPVDGAVGYIVKVNDFYHFMTDPAVSRFWGDNFNNIEFSIASVDSDYNYGEFSEVIVVEPSWTANFNYDETTGKIFFDNFPTNRTSGEAWSCYAIYPVYVNGDLMNEVVWNCYDDGGYPCTPSINVYGLLAKYSAINGEPAYNGDITITVKAASESNYNWNGGGIPASDSITINYQGGNLDSDIEKPTNILVYDFDTTNSFSNYLRYSPAIESIGCIICSKCPLNDSLSYSYSESCIISPLSTGCGCIDSEGHYFSVATIDGNGNYSEFTDFVELAADPNWASNIEYNGETG
ncbi:MAG: hypothetical protein IJX15_05720, partial [Ruminiclostridium sp.]|nr:hypothetical protein [Ruminiclostridium sp.]